PSTREQPRLLLPRSASGRLIGRRAEVDCRRAGEPLLMALPPGLEDIDHRPQALADLRQAVLNPRRHLRIDLADHQTVVLQRTQLLGQHALGDSRHLAPEFAEALDAVLQVIEDDPLPLAINQIERRFDRAAGPVGEIAAFHGDFPIVSKQGLYPYFYSTCQMNAMPTGSSRGAC